MTEKQELCPDCLKRVSKRLYQEDWDILIAVYRAKIAHKRRIVKDTNLTISIVRDSVWRLYGSGLINIKRSGNSTLIKLTRTGTVLCGKVEEMFKKGQEEQP
ncbi:MAG: hypothetical protein JW765_05385 [Deltaproteobacteria bacterium]|nr:hypothetical protein [Candidatus Zymogenaceae bacterium]